MILYLPSTHYTLNALSSSFPLLIIIIIIIIILYMWMCVPPRTYNVWFASQHAVLLVSLKLPTGLATLAAPPNTRTIICFFTSES